MKEFLSALILSSLILYVALIDQRPIMWATDVIERCTQNDMPRWWYQPEIGG